MAFEPVARPSTYRPDIDGLRAVAVVTVVLFHAFPTLLRGGFVGVNIFFVISGYLITGILLRDKAKSIRDFYVRRVRRIFPALLLVLLFTLGVGSLVLLPNELRALAKQVVASGLFSANIALWRESGYFDVAAETKPLLHLWSLGVEEQYYLVWPLFVFWLRERALFGYALGAVLLGSLALCVWGTHTHPTAAFYLPMFRFWELAVGSGLALYQMRPCPALHPSLAVVGAILIALGVGVISKTQAFPGAWALLPTVGALLVIGTGPRSIVGRVLSVRAFVFLGLISYPLYLWHWPLLSLERILVGERASVAVRALTCVLSLALAALTYRMELRVRRSAMWGKPSVLLALMGATVLGSCIVIPERRLWGSPTAELEQTTRTAHERHENCPLPPVDELSSLNFCRGNRTAPPEVALVGDSHADHLFEALAASDSRSWVLLGNSSCPPVLGVNVTGDQRGCEEKFRRIANYLKSESARSIRTVYVAFYQGYVLDSAYAADHVLNHRGPPDIRIDGHSDQASKEPLFERGLDAFLSEVIETGKAVVLVEDNPEFPVLANECVKRPRIGSWLQERLRVSSPCSVERAQVLERQRSYLAMCDRLARRHPELNVFPMLDFVCSKTECPMIGSDGNMLYDDSHHLSFGEAAALAPQILGFEQRDRSAFGN